MKSRSLILFFLISLVGGFKDCLFGLPTKDAVIAAARERKPIAWPDKLIGKQVESWLSVYRDAISELINAEPRVAVGLASELEANLRQQIEKHKFSLETAQEYVRRLVSEKNKVAAKAAKANTEKEILAKQVVEKEAAAQAAEKQLAGANEEVAATKALLETSKESGETLQAELAREKSEKEKLTEKLNSLEEEAGKASENLEKVKDTRDQALKELKEKKLAVEKEKAEAEKKVGEFEGQMAEQKTKREELEKKVAAAGKSLNEMQEKVTALGLQVSKQGDVATGLKTKLGELEKELADKQKELKKEGLSQKENVVLNEQIKKLEGEKDQQEEVLVAMQDELAKMCDELEGVREAAAKKKQELKAIFARKHTVLNFMIEQSAKMRKAKEELEVKLDEKRDFDRRMNDVVAKLLKDKGDLVGRIKQLEKEKASIARELTDKSSQTESTENVLKEQQDLVDALQKKLMEEQAKSDRLQNENTKLEAALITSRGVRDAAILFYERTTKILEEKNAELEKFKSGFEKEKMERLRLAGFLRDARQQMIDLRKQLEEEEKRTRAMEEGVKKASERMTLKEIEKLQREKAAEVIQRAWRKKVAREEEKEEFEEPMGDEEARFEMLQAIVSRVLAGEKPAQELFDLLKFFVDKEEYYAQLLEIAGKLVNYGQRTENYSIRNYGIYVLKELFISNRYRPSHGKIFSLVKLYLPTLARPNLNNIIWIDILDQLLTAKPDNSRDYIEKAFDFVGDFVFSYEPFDTRLWDTSEKISAGLACAAKALPLLEHALYQATEDGAQAWLGTLRNKKYSYLRNDHGDPFELAVSHAALTKPLYSHLSLVFKASGILVKAEKELDFPAHTFLFRTVRHSQHLDAIPWEKYNKQLKIAAIDLARVVVEPGGDERLGDISKLVKFALADESGEVREMVTVLASLFPEYRVAATKIQAVFRGYRTRKYLKTIIDTLGRSVVARLGVREAERTYKSLMDGVNEAIDEAENRGVEGVARFKQEISVGIDLGSIFTEESDWADYETDNERRAKVIKALTLLHRVVLVKRVRDMISVVSEMFGPDIALKDFVKLKFKLDARMKDFAEQLKNVRVAVGRGYSVEARQAILNEIQAELQQLLIDEQARVAEGQQSIIRTLLSGASGEFRKIAPQIPRIFLTALATQLFFKGLGSLFDWALGELPGRYVRLGELPTYTVPGAPDLPLPSMEQLVSSKVIDGNYLADLLKQFPSASSPASVEWKEADPGVLEAVRSLSEKLAASVRKVAETANFTKLDDNVQKVVNAAVEQKISSKMMMDILRSHINLLAEQKASAAGGKGVPGIVPTPLLLAPKPPAESVMKAGEEGYANFTTYFELYGNASMRSLFQNKMKIGFGLASLIFPVAAGSLGIGAVGTIGARLLSAGVRGAVVGGMEGGPGGAAIGGFAAVGGDLFNQAVGGAAAATLNGIGVFEYLGHVRYLVKNFDSVTGARGLAQTMLRVLEAASPYLGDRQIGWANEAIGLLRGALGLQA